VDDEIGSLGLVCWSISGPDTEFRLKKRGGGFTMPNFGVNKIRHFIFKMSFVNVTLIWYGGSNNHFSIPFETSLDSISLENKSECRSFLMIKVKCKNKTFKFKIKYNRN
jgi:hypothetical protein